MLVCVCIFGNLACLYSKDRDLVPSKLHIASTNYNFGIISQGTIVSNQFWISNVGSADVRIIKISGSCSCSGGILESNNVPRGGGRHLVVKYNSGDKNGKFNENVILESNSKYNPITIFNIKGWVLPKTGIVCFPKIIDFGYLENTNSYKADIRLIGHKKFIDKAILKTSSNINTVNRNGPVKTVGGFENLVERVYELRLRVPKIAQNYCEANIDIIGGKGPMSIPVKWSTSREIIAWPQIVLFGIIKNNEKNEQFLKIKGNNFYELNSADPRIEIVKLYHDNVEDMDLYRCTLSGKSVPGGELSGAINVLQKQTGCKIDSIKYYGYLQSK